GSSLPLSLPTPWPPRLALVHVAADCGTPTILEALLRLEGTLATQSALEVEVDAYTYKSVLCDLTPLLERLATVFSQLAVRLLGPHDNLNLPPFLQSIHSLTHLTLDIPLRNPERYITTLSAQLAISSRPVNPRHRPLTSHPPLITRVTLQRDKRHLTQNPTGLRNYLAATIFKLPLTEIMDLISSRTTPSLARLDFPDSQRRDLEVYAPEIVRECERRLIDVFCWEDFFKPFLLLPPQCFDTVANSPPTESPSGDMSSVGHPLFPQPTRVAGAYTSMFVPRCLQVYSTYGKLPPLPRIEGAEDPSTETPDFSVDVEHLAPALGEVSLFASSFSNVDTTSPTVNSWSFGTLPATSTLQNVLFGIQPRPREVHPTVQEVLSACGNVPDYSFPGPKPFRHPIGQYYTYYSVPDSIDWGYWLCNLCPHPGSGRGRSGEFGVKRTSPSTASTRAQQHLQKAHGI
ncbi:hypothetical protein P7C70_g8378, partial [Phenoliferia sp. Uapishka_3]